MLSCAQLEDVLAAPLALVVVAAAAPPLNPPEHSSLVTRSPSHQPRSHATFGFTRS